jgi:hypothetical protein
MPRYIFEFDALGIVEADTEEQAREAWGAMIAAAGAVGGETGNLAALDNYTIYDENDTEIHPDDLEG